MAECSTHRAPHIRVLDPGSGSGILSAAVCEAIAAQGIVESLHIDAYETEPVLADLTQRVFAFSQDWLRERGVALTFDVRNGDFVLESAASIRSTMEANWFGSHAEPSFEYDLVISNPPYFKIGRDDPRAVAWSSVVNGQPNIYALFMSISAELLSKSGQLVYIVPRSFASGPYFRKFREVFFREVIPTAIHLFESRKDVFRNQTVLQENLIIAAQNRVEGEALDGRQVLVSHSKGAHDLAERQRHLVDVESVLDPASEQRELSIPLSAEDLKLVDVMRSWPNTLRSLGLEISTGPVVPFRATEFLADAATEDSTVPLLWMQHVRPMRTSWPLGVCDKPQWIKVSTDSTKLLVADRTYVLIRRFSAKEEKRRLVSAPLTRGLLNADMVGLENHLNYIRGVWSDLDDELAYGLSALLNSACLDRYFRISNGNTQVSATELRAIPLPAEADIRAIGVEVQRRLGYAQDFAWLDSLVAETLSLSRDVCMELESATG
jgi:adenine-specific DNA-methyltransferase